MAGTDHDQGRPVVVVTGMGVLTSLGAGQAGQLGRADGRACRASAGSPASRSTVCAPRSPARSISSPSRNPAPRRRPRRWPGGDRGGDQPIRDRPSGRFSRSAVPGRAARGDRLAATPRARRRVGCERGGQLRRPDAGGEHGRFRPLARAVPVRLGRRASGRPVRHQGLAGRHLHRLRLGRDRDPARGRGDPPRRDRGGAGASAPTPRSRRNR